ncbi:M20/M25/M40 family metallo-hydrolase [Variovorax sp. PvP013]|uniref:M20/M25/M40 family metallo-hydrolase n=1 Tax=Variovorax sp. PvP013 TaxID=3156435 RepID=UPI003D1C49E9
MRCRRRAPAVLAGLAGLCLVGAMRMAQAQGAGLGSSPWPVSPQVERTYVRLLAAPAVQAVLDAVAADHARSIDDLRRLTEIEAPPFGEQARAAAFLARLKALGLPEAYIDTEGNVVGLRRGRPTATGHEVPKLVVTAHLDTVFPAGTDVRVKARGDRLHAPGISDDARGLAVLLSWLKVLEDRRLRTVGDLLFVGSVGEEELGNLRGMRHLFATHRDIDGLVGLEPAPDHHVIVAGTASRRHEVVFEGPGGHSFGAFGRVPSAVHGMGRAIARIADIRTPAYPRTTFTVGTASGGSAVNAIAAEARMGVDIRSDDDAVLDQAERRVLGAVKAAVAAENRRWGVDTLTASVRLIGDRPGGRTPPDSPVVEAAVRANTAYGLRSVLQASSTDANVPMSLGVPAVVLGSGGRTGGFHTTGEWIELDGAWLGAQRSLLTVLALVGVEGTSEPLLPRRAPRAP